MLYRNKITYGNIKITIMVKKFYFSNNIPNFMTKNYFKLISKSLHIYEKEFEDDNILNVEDPRKKINWIIDKLRIKFKSNFNLGKDITIDEFLIFFKGRNSMKFYKSLKPIKWGFKVLCKVDLETNYLYNLFF